MATGMDGGQLRSARLQSGLGYDAFASALGIGKGSLSRYERGELPLPRKVALAVAGLLAELNAGTDKAEAA